MHMKRMHRLWDPESGLYNLHATAPTQERHAIVKDGVHEPRRLVWATLIRARSLRRLCVVVSNIGLRHAACVRAVKVPDGPGSTGQLIAALLIHSYHAKAAYCMQVRSTVVGGAEWRTARPWFKPWCALMLSLPLW